MPHTRAQLAKQDAVVVFSGGQDSTTVLYWALERFRNVSALTFDYGQRHRVELKCAKAIAKAAGVPQKVLKINTFSQLGGNALMEDMPIRMPKKGLPNTFVPGRNLIFFTYAAAFSYKAGVHHLVTGVSQTDYSGYPDCRANTLKALERSLSLGMEHQIVIHTPLSGKDKAQTVIMAKRNGALEVMGLSHTCYKGERPGCGSCPACKLRAKGFKEAGIPDPLFNSGK